MRKLRAHWLCFAGFGIALSTIGSVQAQDALDAHVQAAAKLLDVRAQAALGQITDTDRQLLAMRGYLRSGNQFGDRWSWTQEEIDRYNRSREKVAAASELERIKTKFAEMNPGYTLQVNTAVRSLDVQIARWNSNPSVAKTAVQLQAAVKKELKKGYPSAPTLGSTARFAAFLSAWVPNVPAPLAVPGLSRHGQARAFDFHVVYGDRVIASTNIDRVKAVWDRQGCATRLKEAVQTASDRFVGPLAAPYEPWHYEYTGHDATLADAEPPRHERVSARESGT